MNTISFAVVLGNSEPPPAFLTITNGGGGNLTGLRATTAYGPGQPTGWLGLVLSSNRAPSTLQVGAHLLGLYTGTYNATVTVSGNRGASQTLTVTFTVTRDPATYFGAYALNPRPILSCPNFGAVGFGTVEIPSMALSVPIADSIELHTTWVLGGASRVSSFTVPLDPVAENFRTAARSFTTGIVASSGSFTLNATLAVAGTFVSMTQFKARVDATGFIVRDLNGVRTAGVCTPVSVDLVGTK
jgi:hypothetical protein